MEFFSWISNDVAMAVLGLGLPGLIFLIFCGYFVHMQKAMSQYDKHMSTQKETYDKHMAETRQMYLNNASLTKRYAELADELMGTVRLNTQILTQLSEQIKTNTFCPQLRKEGPNR